MSVTLFHTGRLAMLLSLLLAFQAMAQDSQLAIVGSVALVKGVVTAKSQVRELTTLDKGSPIYVGDTIETMDRSFLVIRFTDAGKLTLRPNTEFTVDQYSAQPGQEAESFTLLKGGLRAVTGAIGKSKPQNVNYTLRNSTIGIRGTEFVARLCEDCSFDQLQASPASTVNEGPNDIDDELVINKKDGTKTNVTRKELRELLQGLYVSVVEGVVRLSADDWYIDIGAGDACFDQLVDQALDDDNEEEVNCFLRGRRLEDIDPYLSGDEEGLMYWNGIGEDDFIEGDAICEIL